MEALTFTVPAEEEGTTLAAALRKRLLGQSWSTVRQLIAARRVKLIGALCLDPARRVHAGEAVELLPHSAPRPRPPERIEIRHLDEHVIVVEKPTGMASVRHPLERDWPAERKALEPTLDETVPRLLAQREGKSRKGPAPRLRIVHRLDKATSGLLVFARSVLAEQELGRQFRHHTVLRRYLALVPGVVGPQTIRSYLIRDRGDGRRGSIQIPGQGKEAITHLEVVERLRNYTLVGCRLETGRTHQIRIHLSELGHPVCGETVYNRPRGGEPITDVSRAPRLFLHAAELGFVHPGTKEALHWSMPLPLDLQFVLERLRGE